MERRLLSCWRVSSEAKCCSDSKRSVKSVWNFERWKFFVIVHLSLSSKSSTFTGCFFLNFHFHLLSMLLSFPPNSTLPSASRRQCHLPPHSTLTEKRFATNSISISNFISVPALFAYTLGPFVYGRNVFTVTAKIDNVCGCVCSIDFHLIVVHQRIRRCLQIFDFWKFDFTRLPTFPLLSSSILSPVYDRKRSLNGKRQEDSEEKFKCENWNSSLFPWVTRRWIKETKERGHFFFGNEINFRANLSTRHLFSFNFNSIHLSPSSPFNRHFDFLLLLLIFLFHRNVWKIYKLKGEEKKKR